MKIKQALEEYLLDIEGRKYICPRCGNSVRATQRLSGLFSTDGACRIIEKCISKGGFLLLYMAAKIPLFKTYNK